MPDSVDSERLNFEKTKWEFERDCAVKELELKQAEMSIKKTEVERGRWSNPLTVAIIAALFASVANSCVTWQAGRNQLAIENYRVNTTRDLEESKAELSRIFEALKIGNTDQAFALLTTMNNLGMIVNPQRSESIRRLIASRPGAPPPSIVTFRSGWVDGGHDQKEMCDRGIAQFAQSYPGKSITVVSSSEDSRKDFFGHVQYNYLCNLKIS